MADVTVPYTLCILSTAAAVAAAALGHYLRPAARDKRKRARQMRMLRARCQVLEQQVANEWLRVAGQLAVHDAEALLLRMLAVHPELHDLQALTAKKERA
jgi:hypothetical protein